jgi:hypothetical protein
METQGLNKMATEIAEMDRPQLVDLLRGMECSFPLDFTDEYLSEVSVDRLRHIALAASIHRLKAA